MPSPRSGPLSSPARNSRASRPAAPALATLVALLSSGALVVGCVPRKAPAPSGPKVDREELPYLLPPSADAPAGADAELLRQVDAAYHAKLLMRDTAGATAAA